MNIRKSNTRGHADHGWLRSKHSFSFADYYDPRHMGFRDLRVINEDWVAPGRGFGAHPHRDMEIISYVVDGALEHADSMGNGSVIRPGDVQRMSAGTGVVHSEYNHSKSDAVKFLQIWVLPEERGRAPSYAQKHFSAEARRNTLCLVASSDGRDDSVSMNQQADLFASLLSANESVKHALRPGRHAWLQLISGKLRVNDDLIEAGDGWSTSEAGDLVVSAVEDAHFLLFDLA